MTARAVALALAALTAGSAADGADRNEEDRFRDLLRGEPGVTLAYARDGHAEYEVRNGQGELVGRLMLGTQLPGSERHRFETKSFEVEVWTLVPDPAAVTRLVHLAHEIADRDDGSFGFQRMNAADERLPHRLLWGAVLAASLTALALGFWRRGQVVRDIRMPHVVPAAIQTLIFVYWSIYWGGVAGRVPSILLQIALAYAVEASLAFSQGRIWRIGAAPLPVVMSANLFAWFDDPGALLVVVGALASKTFLRRGSKHVFNPSAFGLALAGILSLRFEAFSFGGTFSTLDMAPNAAELLLLLALVPQVRFRIVLVSLVAAQALLYSGRILGHVPGLVFPGTLLTFALFITDPATLPGTPVGRVLFGAFVGAAIGATAKLLNMTGYPDDLSKVFPVPVANLLVPVFDRAGRWLEGPFLDVLKPQWNLLHLAAWFAVIIPIAYRDKPRQFEAALHWNYGTPYVKRGADDVPRCEDNPVFCDPFSFLGEARLWLSSRPSR